MKIPNNVKEIDCPDDFLKPCPECGYMNVSSILETNYYVCSGCEFHFNRTKEQIISAIADSAMEFESINHARNPIGFKGYIKKQEQLKQEYKMDEAIATGVIKIKSESIAIGIMDTRFIMGSLSSIVGDKIVELFDYAINRRIPVIIYTCSGGARMQEGIIALMQMAKVSIKVKQHSDAGLFYMPILTNPTTGGVSASFAQLGDVIIAEPNALICFAGPRVIKSTINQELPEGFQKSDFILENGFIDKIVKRSEQREFIYKMALYNRGKDEKN